MESAPSADAPADAAVMLQDMASPVGGRLNGASLEPPITQIHSESKMHTVPAGTAYWAALGQDWRGLGTAVPAARPGPVGTGTRVRSA